MLMDHTVSTGVYCNSGQLAIYDTGFIKFPWIREASG